MQLVNQAVLISVSPNQGEFSNESSNWLLGDADTQKNAGKLDGRQLLVERATICPSHSFQVSVRVHKPTGQSHARPTAPPYLLKS